ncbi:MAG TPA: alpha/beta hydrolase domain-containing protein, partial [Solirubrobacterales bacterium]|nr:alpha/beta hydrolase domain-containing protein [Solirubrobacterales bacterium]
VLSETENRTPRTEPDTADYRHWEVAGGSHLPRMAFDNFQAPIERDLGFTLAASCEEYPLSRVQWPLVVNSAYEHLVAWANGGPAPPIAPRGQYQPTPPDPTNQLVRNGLGIAQGAIRLPEMSVPARLNTGVNSIAPGGGLFSAFCGLLGSTDDLSDDVLLARYDDWADYIAQVTAKANQTAAQGYILGEEVERLIQMHREVPNLRPTEPDRSSGKAKNKGKFTLTWEGTEAPLSTFELQRSKNGGKSWSGVPGADALDDPVHRFTGKNRAKDGKWRYRSRSHTTVPADAVREEFVVTTPWSENSTKVTVDNTKPKLKLRCPKKVKRGKKAFARIKASDKGVGLRKDPSGKKRSKTKRAGKRKIKAKAVDRLGNKRTKSCRVKVKR